MRFKKPNAHKFMRDDGIDRRFPHRKEKIKHRRTLKLILAHKSKLRSLWETPPQKYHEVEAYHPTLSSSDRSLNVTALMEIIQKLPRKGVKKGRLCSKGIATCVLKTLPDDFGFDQLWSAFVSYDQRLASMSNTGRKAKKSRTPDIESARILRSAPLDKKLQFEALADDFCDSLTYDRVDVDHNNERQHVGHQAFMPNGDRLTKLTPIVVERDGTRRALAENLCDSDSPAYDQPNKLTELKGDMPTLLNKLLPASGVGPDCNNEREHVGYEAHIPNEDHLTELTPIVVERDVTLRERAENLCDSSSPKCEQPKKPADLKGDIPELLNELPLVSGIVPDCNNERKHMHVKHEAFIPNEGHLSELTAMFGER